MPEDAAVDGGKPQKRKASELPPSSASDRWAALLEARLRPRWEEASAAPAAPSTSWGDLPSEQPAKCRRPAEGPPLKLLLGGGQELRVEQGRGLLRASPVLLSMLAQAPPPPAPAADEEQDERRWRILDLSAAGTSPLALRLAVQFAAGSPGQPAAALQALWQGGPPRPAARGARPGEAPKVEDALHSLDVLRAAEFLGLSGLKAAAEEMLLPPGGRLQDSTALPLFAASWGRHKALSAAALQLLTERFMEILWGRERQLGVLYATHPVPATVLSGVYKATLRSPSEKTALATASAPGVSGAESTAAAKAA